MIEMRLADVAAVTGGRLHRASGDERVTAVEFDSRAIGPGGLFLALPGERADGHDFAAAALAAGAAAVLAARAVDAPAVIVPPAEHTGATGCWDLPRRCGPRRRRCRRARRAGPAGRPCRPRTARADRRRRHRQLRQDLDQGPARRGARPARAHRGPARARSTTSWACPGRRCAPTPTPGTWCWSFRARPRPHRRAGRGRAAADRRGAQRRPRAPGRVRLHARPSPRPRASWSRRCRRDGVAVLNADDPRSRAMAARTAARVVLVGRGAGRRGAGRGRRARRRAGPASAWSPRPARRDGGAAAGRRAPRRQRAGRGRGGARARRHPGRRSRPRSARPLPVVALADGGHRPPGRRHGGQRRVQRQPGVDARRAAPALAAPRVGAGAPHLGGARPDGRAGRRRARRARRGGGRGPRGSASTSWSRSDSHGLPGRPAGGRRRRGAIALLRRRAASPVTSCWSRRPGRPAWSAWPPGCWSGELARPSAEAGGAVRGVFIAAGVALAVSILLTPYLIRFFSRQGFGQEIRAEGPQSHQAKRGTPTMGGVAILLAIWLGYLVAHLVTGEPVTAVGAAGAVPDHRAGRRRLPRRLHQDPQAAQPRAEQDLEAGRPAAHRGGLRRSSALRFAERRRAHARRRTACRSSATSRCSRSARSGSCCSATWSSPPGRTR